MAAVVAIWCVADSSAWAQSVVKSPRMAPAVPKKLTLEDRTAAYFANRKDMKPGELITRSDVESLVKTLSKEGYETKNFEPLLKNTVPDQSLLARQLRSPSGKQFAQQTSQYPMGYDRLDHLANLPDGAGILQKLVDGPDGYKLIEYMATQPGGAELGRQLSQTPTGGNFNGSTGKIYTAEQLVTQLKKEAEPKKKSPQRGRP